MLGRSSKPYGTQASSSNAAEYEPLNASGDDVTIADSDDVEQHSRRSSLEGSTMHSRAEEVPFSRLEYAIFLLLGVAMLWAWNMFLAAAPYFAARLAASPSIQATFQPSILAVSTVTNLVVMLVLSNMQSKASYPLRINMALSINMLVFVFLTGSTVLLAHATPKVYLGFVLVMVCLSSWATGLIQNGAFAFAASFGRSEYMQALMAGQGIAGVLPPLTQIFSVLAYPPSTKESDDGDDQASAFLYFITAVILSLGTLIAFIPLSKRHAQIVERRLTAEMAGSVASVEEAEQAARKPVSLLRLFSKLRWLALGLILTFTETMFFPVFTSKILSVNDGPNAGALFHPAAFIAFAFLFWNIGDLSGRLATSLPFTLGDRPFLLFLLAAARAAYILLYLLCNIGGRGAVVPSDAFYLVIVQLIFGLTNGWLGASCMMAAGDYVEDEEREAAGGFMGLCLVIGLAAGSFLSFTVAGV